MTEARSATGLYFLQFLAFMGWTLDDWRKLNELEMQYFFAAFSEKNKREHRESERARQKARRARR